MTLDYAGFLAGLESLIFSKARPYLKRLLFLLAALSTLVMVAVSYISWRNFPTDDAFLTTNRTFFGRLHSTDKNQLFGKHAEKGATVKGQQQLKSSRDSNKRRKGVSDVKTSTPRAKPRTTREWLSSAAADIKCSFVPGLDKFAQDSYFHPQMHMAVGSSSTPALLMKPDATCSSHSKDMTDPPMLLVLVLSGYRQNDTEERRAVRDTYGSIARGGRWPGKPVPMLVRLVFLLGRPPSEETKRQVEAESGKFDDLVVGDFIDSYVNLTLKVLHGLRWAVRHCPQAGYVLKADDDTFVNLPLLTTFLLERGRPNSAYGHVYFTSRVVRKGRWAVSNTDYPLENYPPYLSGTAYALSLDAARKIVEASDRMPLIPIEDAYVTGVLAVVAGVRRMSTKGFTYFAEHKADLCEFVLDARLVGNKMAAVDKYTLWNTLRIDDRRLCDAQSHIPRA